MAESKIIRPRKMYDVDYAYARLNANSDHVSITAPAKSGYNFWFWVNVHTTGWLEGLFFEDPSSATTNVWRNSGMASPSISQGGDVYALAIYTRY